MKNFKLWDKVLGIVVFAIAMVTYGLTIEPTASFWDCPEFITTAFKLEVGHPPGAPFFMLTGKFFSLFASDPTQVAYCINMLSAFLSALTILFLFWTITLLAKRMIVGKGGEMSLAQSIVILGSGLVGSLAYTFSDTFWFSAVEAEVYAYSSFLTAIVFWLILKWEEKADEAGSDRYLILITYLMGLSIGVHLLNLLTIPAIVLVYYFRKYEASIKGTIIALLVSFAILVFVLYGLIPGFISLAGYVELFFVNTLGLPFNSGALFYCLLTVGVLVWSIIELYKEKVNFNLIKVSSLLAICLMGLPFIMGSIWIGLLIIAAIIIYFVKIKEELNIRMMSTIMVCLAMMLLGYTTYAVIVVRSAANPPMDQNSPDNVFSLKYYLNREQYGDTPLFYGQTYNAPVKLEVKGNMCIPVEKKGHAQYAPAPKVDGEKDRYVVTGYKTSYEFMDEFKMLFPRMHSSQGHHVDAYKSWADVKGKRIRYDYCGQKKTEYCPTFGENLRFFFRYQVNFMYWRYFMWNFAGRQNDIQSHGDLTKGNWISGIPFIDNAMLGDQSKLPSELRENKGHNVYYFLPLILGLIGLFWQLGKRNNTEKNKEGYRSFAIVFLLFFLTGLAIVVYLNQTPYQPRERDYAYAGSFYAFCIWIGLGVMAIIDMFNQAVKNEKARVLVAVATVIETLLVPAQMASQNWDDHDRSNRYAARDFGANYLKSCDEEAIIFCNGDNDTFPLWYNIEVEEERNDVRACNLSYLQTDWYISQMKRPYYNSPALPISWDEKDYMPGKNEVVWVENRLNAPLEVKKAFQFLHSTDPRTKRDGEGYIPSDQLYVLSPDGQQIPLKKAKRFTRSEMMVMEMLSTNEWKRPFYFAVTIGNDYHLGLDPYLELTGLAYRITPERSKDGRPRVNTEVMYDNMLHKFKYGNMNVPGIYIDENTMRMCRTHRMMFFELIEALYNEGKRDKCLEVLDFAEEVLPGYNIPYDYTSASMAQYYYQLGEIEKGNAIMTKVADTCAEYLMWGASLDKDNRAAAQSTLGHQSAIFGYVLQTLERYQQKDLFNQYYDIYAQYASR